MIDIVREIEAVHREVGEDRIPAGHGRSVRLERDYEAPIEDVWDAVTNPERIGRWFLPISGDYRIGGRYQLEGNAGGQILECNRPSQFKVTWVYGPMPSDVDISEVEVRLSAVDGGTTRLHERHRARNIRSARHSDRRRTGLHRRRHGRQTSRGDRQPGTCAGRVWRA